MASTRQRFSPVMSDIGDRALSPTLSASSRTTTSLPTDLSDVSSIDGEDFEVIEAPSPDRPASSPQQTPLMDSFDDLGDTHWSRSSLLDMTEGDDPVFPLSPLVTPMTASDALMTRSSWASITQHDVNSDSMSSSQLRFPDPLDSSFQLSQRDGQDEAEKTIVGENATLATSDALHSAPRMRERTTSASTLNARAANIAEAPSDGDGKEGTVNELPPIQRNLLLHLIKTMSKETVTTLICLVLFGFPAVFSWLYYAHTTVGPVVVTPTDGVYSLGQPTPITPSPAFNTAVGKALLMLSPKRNNALMVVPSYGPCPEVKTRSTSYRHRHRSFSIPTAAVPESKSVIVRQKASLSLHASNKISGRVRRSSRNAKRLMRRLPKSWKEWMRAAHEYVKPVVMLIVNDIRQLEAGARQSWERHATRQKWDNFNERFRSTYEDFKSYAHRTSNSVKWQWDDAYQRARQAAAYAGGMIYKDLVALERTVSDTFTTISTWSHKDWNLWMMAAISQWQSFVAQFRKETYGAHVQAIIVQQHIKRAWHSAYEKAGQFAANTYTHANSQDQKVDQNAALAYRRLTLQKREQKYETRRQRVDDDQSDMPEHILETARRAYEKVLLQADRSRVRLEDAWSGWRGGKSSVELEADATLLKQMQDLYKYSQKSTERSLRRTMRKGRRLRRKMMKSNKLKRFSFV